MEVVVVILIAALVWFGPMKSFGVCKPELPSTPVEQSSVQYETGGEKNVAVQK